MEGKKIRIRKEVIPVGALGEYQIILHIENISPENLVNLKITETNIGMITHQI